MKIHIKNIEGLTIPKSSTPESSGYDIVALSDPNIVGIPNADTKGVDETIYWDSIDYIEYKTGVFIAPQQDAYMFIVNKYHTLVLPRSSISKYNLILANSIGLIDNDYRGEILFRFKYVFQPEDFRFKYKKTPKNDGGNLFFYESVGLLGTVNKDKIYKKGDKLGQLVAEVSNPIDWIVVADLNNTIRGSGGFGSTEKRTEDVNKTSKPVSKILSQYQEKIQANIVKPVNYEEAIKEREKQLS